MATRIEVTGCLGCPLADDEYDECCHPAVMGSGRHPARTDRATPAVGHASPDWCPLRTEDALVTLRVKETPDAR